MPRPAVSPVVLVTAFEPFGGEAVNASALAVAGLAGRDIAGHRVETALLPVVFGDCARVLREHLRRLRPSLVVCTGQAAGRGEISLERIAINLDDTDRPDNAGVRAAARPVRPGGPAAYWSTLPIDALLPALRAQDLPAGASVGAGTFVCNHLFYELMHALRRRPGCRGGFVHVPVTPAQAATCVRGSSPPLPSLAPERTTRALALIVETTLAT